MEESNIELDISNKLYGLDLFSGIGGITLALSEWVKPIAYCENDRYAQAVLLSRMSEGKLPVAPIWDDVRTLKGAMLPIQSDIIYGGFPCQDISVAGKQKGIGGERSGLFFEIIRLVDEIRPNFVFLENVPNIRTKGLDRVLQEFTQRGYDCRWTMLSAREIGAPHKRERWFFLASKIKMESTNNNNNRFRKTITGKEEKPIGGAETTTNKCFEFQSTNNRDERIQRIIQEEVYRLPGFSWCEDVRGIKDLFGRSTIPEPLIRGNCDGVSYRMDRTKCLGNSVLPIQAKEAFKRLINLNENFK